MSAVAAVKRRRSSLPARALRVLEQPRYAELCRRYPGPAAFIDRDGHVLDHNDRAQPMLDAVEARPGGLGALATAIGGFAHFEGVELAGPDRVRLELAIMPLAEGVLLLGRDRALVDNLHGALAESRTRYKDLVELSSDFAWETDAQGVFSFVSPRGALGHAPRDLIGRRADEVLPEVDREGERASPFMARVRLDDASLWLRRRDGEAALLSVSALPLTDASGQWQGARGVAHDITDVTERETALAEAEHRDRLLGHVLRALVENVDPLAGLAAALRACVRSFGASGGCLWRRESGRFIAAATCGAAAPDDLVIDSLATNDDVDAAMATRGDARRLVLATAFRQETNGTLALWRGAEEPQWPAGDIALFCRLAAQFGLALAQLDAQQELERQARTDALTGLLNRRSFLGEIEARLSAARRAARPAALVYVDLDNFKAVNDLHGHPAGDRLLRAFAERLRGNARASDLVARLGGDEFALWLDDTDAHGAEAKGLGLLELRAAIASHSAAPEKPLGLSIGLAVFDPVAPESVAQLIERADAAMYTAKRGGKGRLAMAPARSAS